MSVFVSTNALISINGTDLSDHAKTVRLNSGQQTRSATAHGNTFEVFRAGLTTYSVDATFYNDHASGSVESILRGLIGITASSSGFAVVVQKVTGSTGNPTSTSNPKYTFSQMIIDGDLNVLDESVGEIAEIPVRFIPFGGTLSIQTTSS